MRMIARDIRLGVLALCLLLWPVWALAQDAPASRAFALPGDAVCPVALPEPGPPGGWTGAERLAWGRICLGRPANMQEAGPTGFDGRVCAPWAIDGPVPGHRLLRPEFLNLILTREPWVSTPPKRQVRILCARIDGVLDLENARVVPELILLQSHLPEGANLLGARFLRTLSFQRSRLDGPLNANRARIGGGLYLRGGARFQEIDLTSARVAGSVIADGSRFEGRFNGDGLTVGGGLFMREGAAFQTVVLRGASVARNLETDGSTFQGVFDADALAVGGSLFLRGGAAFQDVYLSDATVTRDMQLAGSTFAGVFDFSSGAAEELVLFRPGTLDGDGALREDPIWTGAARLILSNAELVTLQARLASWRRGTGALPTDLGGLGYDRLSGFRGERVATLEDASAAELIGWLRDVSGHRSDYDPQPYEQLSAALRVAGMAAKADAVAYAKFRHRDATQPAGPWQTHLLRPAERLLVGNGVYPFRAVGWFGALVALGVVMAYFSAAPYLGPFYRKVFYSLENALPLVGLSEEHLTLDHRNRWVEGYFKLQKFGGFVLATVLVGALTILTGS